MYNSLSSSILYQIKVVQDYEQKVVQLLFTSPNIISLLLNLDFAESRISYIIIVLKCYSGTVLTIDHRVCFFLGLRYSEV